MSSRDLSNISLNVNRQKSNDPWESKEEPHMTSWGSKSSINITKNDDNIRKVAANIAKNVRNELSSKPIPKGKYLEVQASSSSTNHEKSERETSNLKETSSLLGKSKEQLRQETRIKIKTVIMDHKLSISEISTKFETKIDLKVPTASYGLSSEACKAKLSEFGQNKSKKVVDVPWYFKFLECLTKLFNLLLIFAGIVFLIFYFVNPLENFQNSYVGSTMIVIAFINAFIEFYELQKISSLLSSFREMVANDVCVIREGKEEFISQYYLVPGDILKLRSGSKIAADGILIHSYEFRVDASNITGEANSVEKKVIPNGAKDIEDAFDSPNMIFQSNIVVSGEAYAIVTRTGDKTLLNQINTVTQKSSKKRSPLSKEIRIFCRRISLIAVLIGLIFFIVAAIRARNFNQAITFLIGSILSWIPQGLPLTVTFLLAVSGRRMLQKNVVVKDLHGVETLGAITLLATDKTGTLTKNEMLPMELWVNDSSYSMTFEKSLDLKPLKLDIPGVAQVLHICATCTRARIENSDKPDEERRIIGDPTESALLKYTASKLKNIDKISDLFPKVFEISFTSDTKRHITIHRKGHSQGLLTLHVKGAPEEILESCSTILLNGKIEPITENQRKKIQQVIKNMCKKGQRVLGFAQLQLRGDKFTDNYRFSYEKQNFPLNEYTFVGLMGLADPPKPEVHDAILTIRGAGIKVIVITGDHSETALNVAKQVNIVTTSSIELIDIKENLPIKPSTKNTNSICVKGSVLSYLSDEDWLNIFLYEEILFYRTLASQKLEIVSRAQSLGHIVAVTGDGFNDSPALKKADIGIAMNKSGSDVSKESAGMILLDDNFASTVSGIQEGRLVFINLKKAIQYTISHLVAEAFPHILFVIVPIPLAITSTQILTVDLGFELLITLSFGWEHPENKETLMTVPPRKSITNEVAIQNFNQNQQRKANFNELSNVSTDSEYLLNENDGDEDNINLAQEYKDKSAHKAYQTRFKTRTMRHLHEIKLLLSDRNYWRSQYESIVKIVAGATDEKLVDSRVLIWSYLIAGVIECVGALVTFYMVLWFEFGISPKTAKYAMLAGPIHFKPHSPDLIREDGTIITGDVQYEALLQARSAFYLSILVIQLFNLIACKARDNLPFGRFMISNDKTWVAMFAGTIYALLMVYTPPANAVFGTSMGLNPIYVLVPLCFGVLLLLVSIILTLFRQRYYPQKRVKQITNPLLVSTNKSALLE